MQIRETTLAYIAGIIDGEGCIGFSRHSTGNRSIFPRVMVVNSNRELLEFIKSVFDGNIHEHKRQKENWSRVWSWRLSNQRVVPFLELIQPWVRIKAHQIHLVFAWNATRPGRGKVSGSKRIEYQDSQSFLMDCMSFLNHRGINTRTDPLHIEMAKLCVAGLPLFEAEMRTCH